MSIHLVFINIKTASDTNCYLLRPQNEFVLPIVFAYTVSPLMVRFEWYFIERRGKEVSKFKEN